MPLVIFRGIYEAFDTDDFLAVPAVECVRDIWPAHIVVVYLPVAAGLRKLSAFVLYIFDARGGDVAGYHVGVFEHSRYIRLEGLVPSSYDVLYGEIIFS